MERSSPGTALITGASSGIDPAALPAEQAMPVGVMVYAALAGFDFGEVVTLPALDDVALYRDYEAARRAMGPHLSRAQPAARYAATVTA